MDTRTGEIKHLTDEEVARARMALADGERPHRSRLVPIPPGELSAVEDMNRKDRRAWAAKQRKAERKALRSKMEES